MRRRLTGSLLLYGCSVPVVCTVQAKEEKIVCLRIFSSTMEESKHCFTLKDKNVHTFYQLDNT